MARLRVVREQLKKSNNSGWRKLEGGAPSRASDAMIHLIARVMGIGIETADTSVNEILSRHLRAARPSPVTLAPLVSPDEKRKRRREKGLARAGNARVRRGMIQLAWRFLRFQKDSELAQWFRARAADGRRSTKTMIAALARAAHRAVAHGDDGTLRRYDIVLSSVTKNEHLGFEVATDAWN